MTRDRRTILWLVRSVLTLSALVWAGAAQAGDNPVDPSSRPPLSTGKPEDPPDPPDVLYDGNHVGWMVGPALQILDSKVTGLDSQGQGLRLGARISAVTQFVDGGIDVQHVEHGGPAASLSRTDLGVRLGSHPALPIVVFNSWLNDVISGIHLYMGATVSRLALQGAPAVQSVGLDGPEAVQWRSTPLVGVGADFPVSPRNRSSGWWLTVRYELHWTDFGSSAPRHDLGADLLSLQLGYRSYRSSWARIARPF